jgi:hypothetical protein
MHKILFYFEFKIDQNAFYFIPNFINKSCIFTFLNSNQISLAIFGFFYTFLWILQVSYFAHMK